MAWQLHYTSARAGKTGRSGFQFVAASPGLPPGVEATVVPYLTYRPPPDAPAAPAAEEVAGFPVAFSYDLAGGHALLVRCRYLGRDYSGRYGNFLAHAVVAEPGELEGVRPIELWRAACWRDAPADGDLPVLDDLAPGDTLDPGTLAGRLAAERASGLLAHLLDEVVATLDRGHGRVILVADDADAIARWIAMVSYSLPAAAAAALSFVTYTDDPAGAPYRLVGTTPAIWAAGARSAPVFFLDPAAPRDLAGGADQKRASTPGVGRYARTAADCWRAHDLAGLDALGELSGLGSDSVAGSGFDTAAALLALCRGDPTVTGDEQAAAAGLLRRHGGEVPAWVWRDLAPAVPRIGFELAAALCDLTGGKGGAPERAPSGVDKLAERCAARCVLLALADPRLRPRLPKWALGSAGGSRAGLAPAFADAVAAAPGLVEIAAIAALAERCHVPLPTSEVTAAAARCAGQGAGADLPDAIKAIPSGHRDGLIAGALAGLESAAPHDRPGLLTDAVCDLLADRDLTGTPRVALRVLGSVGRRRPARRVELTRAAVALERADRPAAEIDAAIRELWSGEPPTVAECGALLDSWGPDSVAAALARYPALAGLPSRAFAAARGELDAPEVIALAERIGAMPWRDGSGATTRADAAIVKGYTEVTRSAARAIAVPELATALDRVAATRASAVLIDAAFAGVAARLSGRTPEFRDSLLAALTEPARARLSDRLAAKPERRGLDRRKLFRRRGG